MLKEILDGMVTKLTEAGVENVYSAFDAYPIEKKGQVFTVIGIGALETCAPIYSQFSVYLPFKTEIELNLTANKDMSMPMLYNYYCDSIEPVVMGMTDMNCSLKKMAIKFDSNIQRLVLTVRLSASGMNRMERSSP